MKPVLTIAATGTLALALVACGGESGQNPVDGKTFTMVLGADPGNLDPHFTSLAGALQVDRFLYDSLVNIDEQGKLVAGLADKWEATTTRATFTLRKGVTCADGSPLTAASIAANINFVGDAKNASSRIGVFVQPGATAVGDDTAGTVTVTSPAPDAFMDRNVGSLQIVCDKGMQDRGLLKQGGVGTGMFKVTEAVAGDHYTLERRKDYAWGPGDWQSTQAGLPDKVVFRIVANEATTANLLMSKEVNAAGLVGPDRQRLESLYRKDVLAMLGEMWFNHKAGLPGADEDVRRALVQAVDLGQLTQVMTSGTGQPATGMIAPGFGPCTEQPIGSLLPAHDLEKARSALDAAGWTAGPDGIRAKGGKRLTILLFYPPWLGPTMQASAELVQKGWSAVGAEVTLKGGTDAELSQVVIGGQGQWDAAFVPLNVSVPSQLAPFVSGPAAPDGTNFSGIQNEAYTAAVKDAAEIAGNAGCGKWATAEEKLFERVDVVPFANSSRPLYGQGATFELSQGSVTPGSIRMLG
ncbi:MAG: ABC transporter substrate-binding protein [Kibdelosporangium sp.]